MILFVQGSKHLIKVIIFILEADTSI